MGRHHASRVARTLGIDPTRCDGVGICAHLAPQTIRLDSWGYPILAAGRADDEAWRAAKAAVAACPKRALFVSTRPS